MTSVRVLLCFVTCGSPLSILAPDSRELAANIWTILKTLLFMTVMLSQSVLSTITYTRPVSSTAAPQEPERSATHTPTHSSLALSTLRTLSHLSFVITKFGGVTSTSNVGFAELKRVFYSALDVLSADVEASETFVKSLNTHGLSITWCCPNHFTHISLFQVSASSSTGGHTANPLIRARQTFNLACIEQLVPLLGLETIENIAFPLCLPYVYIMSSVHNALTFILVTWMTHHIARHMSLRTRSFWQYSLRMRARNRIRPRWSGSRAKARCERPS